MKAKGRSIPARASSVSCNSLPKATCRSASLLPLPNIFICCAAKRFARGASRWWSSRRRACFAILTRLRLSKILPSPRFQNLVRDNDVHDAKSILIASGKVGHELRAERRRRNDTSTAIFFLDQLYPLPKTEIAAAIDEHPNAREIVWVQEEPANMGALFYVLPRLERIAQAKNLSVRSVKRSSSASPATGSAKAHELEQKTLITLAFATTSNS